MLDFGNLRSVSLVMDCSCMAPLTPAVIVMRGFSPAFVPYSVHIVGRILYVFV